MNVILANGGGGDVDNNASFFHRCKKINNSNDERIITAATNTEGYHFVFVFQIIDKLSV